MKISDFCITSITKEVKDRTAEISTILNDIAKSINKNFRVEVELYQDVCLTIELIEDQIGDYHSWYYDFYDLETVFKEDFFGEAFLSRLIEDIKKFDFSKDICLDEDDEERYRENYDTYCEWLDFQDCLGEIGA